MASCASLLIHAASWLTHRHTDIHLQTLQLLSAHIKLLLDTPEHLWRLIERKQYYPAAWLFLLARVVHRALVSDEQDDESWRGQGLNVLVRVLHAPFNYHSGLNICPGTVPSCATAMGCGITISATDHSQSDHVTS
jgi:hypothetical protein